MHPEHQQKILDAVAKSVNSALARFYQHHPNHQAAGRTRYVGIDEKLSLHWENHGVEYEAHSCFRTLFFGGRIFKEKQLFLEGRIQYSN